MSMDAVPLEELDHALNWQITGNAMPRVMEDQSIRC